MKQLSSYDFKRRRVYPGPILYVFTVDPLNDRIRMQSNFQKVVKKWSRVSLRLKS